MLTKLTTAEGKSKHGNVTWTVGKWVTLRKTHRGDTLCTEGMLHVYEGGPELAAMLDPVHANIGADARAFEVTGKIVARAGPAKAGGYSFKVIRELTACRPSLVQRIRFGILCAKVVCNDLTWNAWADGWLSGKDRTQESAAAARDAAEAVARDAARVAARDAAWAIPNLDLSALAIEAMKGE